jgi:hypothetical protein
MIQRSKTLALKNSYKSVGDFFAFLSSEWGVGGRGGGFFGFFFLLFLFSSSKKKKNERKK